MARALKPVWLCIMINFIWRQTYVCKSISMREARAEEAEATLCRIRNK